MLRTIQFNVHERFNTEEIKNVRAECVLSAEFIS